MTVSKVTSVSAFEPLEVEIPANDDGSGTLPFHDGCGHEFGNGFFAGNVQIRRSEHSRRYRAVFDTLLLFPEGGATTDLQNGAISLCPYDGVLVPGGSSIFCDLPRRFLFVTRKLGQPNSSRIGKPTRLPASMVLDQPSKPRPSSDFLGQAPVQKLSSKIDVSESSSVGMWNSTPYARHASPHPRFEFMFLQQGLLAAGELSFKAGDLFVVPKGTVVGFKADESVRKIFWILE